jgi:hypothetical protein
MKLIVAVILARRILRLSKNNKPANAIFRNILFICSIVNMVAGSVHFIVCKLFPGQEDPEQTGIYPQKVVRRHNTSICAEDDGDHGEHVSSVVCCQQLRCCGLFIPQEMDI